MEKHYQLTLEECLEATHQKIAPKRTVSPSLILVGVGTMTFWILLLWAGVDAYKVRWLLILIGVSAMVALIGLLLWRWEGLKSLDKQTAVYGRTYSELLKPKVFRFTEVGWSVTCEGAEDHRAVTALHSLHETSKTVALLTDVVHVLPKRIFEPQELLQLQSLALRTKPTSQASEPSPGIAIGNRDFVSASFEYYRWRYPGYLLMFVLAPPFALLVATLSAYLDPDQTSSVLPLQLYFIGFATIVWYLAFPLYEYVQASRRFRGTVFESLSETGFALRLGSHQHQVLFRWEQPFIGHEGRKSFLLEVNRGYFLIPKRLLNADQVAMVRAKLRLKTIASPQA